ncbi:MAG: hypothetical protein WCP57_04255 [Bacteroidota bacterium]
MKYSLLIVCFSCFLLIGACKQHTSSIERSNNVVTTILYEINNPSKTYKCVYYSRIGDTNAQLILHMCVLPIHAPLDSTSDGNVLIAQIKNLKEEKTQLFTSRWENDSLLEVVLMTDFLMKKQENYFINGTDTIQIKYVP